MPDPPSAQGQGARHNVQDPRPARLYFIVIDPHPPECQKLDVRVRTRERSKIEDPHTPSRTSVFVLVFIHIGIGIGIAVAITGILILDAGCWMLDGGYSISGA